MYTVFKKQSALYFPTYEVNMFTVQGRCCANLMVVWIVLQYSVDIIQRFFDDAHPGVSPCASHQYVRVILAYYQGLECNRPPIVSSRIMCCGHHVLHLLTAHISAR